MVMGGGGGKDVCVFEGGGMVAGVGGVGDVEGEKEKEGVNTMRGGGGGNTRMKKLSGGEAVCVWGGGGEWKGNEGKRERERHMVEGTRVEKLV